MLSWLLLVLLTFGAGAEGGAAEELGLRFRLPVLASAGINCSMWI